MVQIQKLDAHERPPAAVRGLFKEFRRATRPDVDAHPLTINLQNLDNDNLPEGISLERWLCQSSIDPVFDQFMGNGSWKNGLQDSVKPIPVYTHRDIPGLQIFPSVFPPSVQKRLLSRLLHRDLSDNRHKTNIHLHYDMTYPGAGDGTSHRATRKSGTQKTGGLSFFEDDMDRILLPKDPTIHSPISIRTLLNSKLRWMTLGGQYNWTDKRYPTGPPPPFPPDIATLLHRIFPNTVAEAAIVNVYSPGDTLSPHRDVSEECDTGLISISFGCEGLFMVGYGDNSGCAMIKLRSGDAVYMSGTSRFAWHGVPKIIPSTCPDWLCDWPDDGDGDDDAVASERFEQWRGWMVGKRINLNVRQMKPTAEGELPA